MVRTLGEAIKSMETSHEAWVSSRVPQPWYAVSCDENTKVVTCRSGRKTPILTHQYNCANGPDPLITVDGVQTLIDRPQLKLYYGTTWYDVSVPMQPQAEMPDHVAFGGQQLNVTGDNRIDAYAFTTVYWDGFTKCKLILKKKQAGTIIKNLCLQWVMDSAKGKYFRTSVATNALGLYNSGPAGGYAQTNPTYTGIAPDNNPNHQPAVGKFDLYDLTHPVSADTKIHLYFDSGGNHPNSLWLQNTGDVNQDGTDRANDQPMSLWFGDATAGHWWGAESDANWRSPGMAHNSGYTKRPNCHIYRIVSTSQTTVRIDLIGESADSTALGVRLSVAEEMPDTLVYEWFWMGTPAKRLDETNWRHMRAVGYRYTVGPNGNYTAQRLSTRPMYGVFDNYEFWSKGAIVQHRKKLYQDFVDNNDSELSYNVFIRPSRMLNSYWITQCFANNITSQLSSQYLASVAANSWTTEHMRRFVKAGGQVYHLAPHIVDPFLAARIYLMGFQRQSGLDLQFPVDSPGFTRTKWTRVENRELQDYLEEEVYHAMRNFGDYRLGGIYYDVSQMLRDTHPEIPNFYYRQYGNESAAFFDPAIRLRNNTVVTQHTQTGNAPRPLPSPHDPPGVPATSNAGDLHVVKYDDYSLLFEFQSAAANSSGWWRLIKNVARDAWGREYSRWNILGQRETAIRLHRIHQATDTLRLTHTGGHFCPPYDVYTDYYVTGEELHRMCNGTTPYNTVPAWYWKALNVFGVPVLFLNQFGRASSLNPTPTQATATEMAALLSILGAEQVQLFAIFNGTPTPDPMQTIADWWDTTFP